LEAGYNIKEHQSTGRKPVLSGAEETLQRFEKDARDLRKTGVSLNVPTMRALLTSMLMDDGHQDLLSPHLYSENGALSLVSMRCALW
jgi:hypothetical protein